MKRGSTLFLRVTISFFSLLVFLLCIRLLLALLLGGDGVAYPFLLLGMLAAAVPFFVGVIQTFKILNHIDTDDVFSQPTMNSLSVIKFCALSITALYIINLPFMMAIAQEDDAPGLALIGLVFTFSPLVVAVFAGIFQQILRDAMSIKSQNDQTI